MRPHRLAPVLLPVLAAALSAQLGPRYEHRRDRTEVFVPAEDDPPQNGNRLLTVLHGMRDAGARRPYRLRLGPGVYDLGDRHMDLPSFVDLEGAGSSETLLTARGADGDSEATVTLRPRASLRRLRVLSRGETRHAVALRVPRGEPRILDVILEAFGASAAATALEVGPDAAPLLVDVTARARAEGLAEAAAARLASGSAPRLHRVQLDADADRGRALGLVIGARAAPTTLDTEVRARSGHGPLRGIEVGDHAQASLRGIRVRTEGGRWNSGVFLVGTAARLTLEGATVEATGGKLSTSALEVSGHGAELRAVGSSITARAAGRAIAVLAREAAASLHLEACRIAGDTISFETIRGVTLETSCSDVEKGLASIKGRFKCRTCAGVPLSRCN